MGKQQDLFEGGRGQTRAKRGKQFENEIIAANEFYAIQRIVHMTKNSERHLQKCKLDRNRHTAESYLRQFADKNDNVSVSGQDWVYERKASDIDFSGGNGSGSFFFDTKETAGVLFPLNRLEEHQYLALRSSARCKGTSGVMINFYELNRVFFVPYSYLEPKREKWIAASFGRKSAPKGTASISVGECEREAIEVFKSKNGGYWDWFTAVTGGGK